MSDWKFLMVSFGIACLIIPVIVSFLEQDEPQEITHLRWYDSDNNVVRYERHKGNAYVASKTGVFMVGEVAARIEEGKTSYDTHGFLIHSGKDKNVKDFIAVAKGKYRATIEVELEKGEKFSDAYWKDAVIRRVQE